MLIGSTALLVMSCHPAARGNDVEPSTSAWSFSVVIDKMTDVRRGIAELQSNESDEIGQHAELIVKCDPPAGTNSLYAEILTPSYLGQTDGFETVQYRFDEEPAETMPADYDDDHVLVADIEDNAQHANWLRRLAGASKLTVQVHDYKFNEFTFTFPAAGARDQIRHVAGACNDRAWINV